MKKNQFLIEKLLKGSAFFGLSIGIISILITLIIRVSGSLSWLLLYHSTLSAHALSMLIFWAPSAMAYFFFIKSRQSFEYSEFQKIGILLATFLFLLGEIGSWMGYLWLPAIQLTPFILTPDSSWVSFFLIINSLGQVILFSFIAIHACLVFVKISSQEEKLDLVFIAIASWIMAACAAGTNAFLQRGLMLSEWSQHLWLPLGHFSLQAMTLALMMIWGSFFKAKQKSKLLWSLKIFLSGGYALFVILGFVHLLPEIFESQKIGPWFDKYIWIPAVSTTGFTLIYIFQYFMAKKNSLKTGQPLLKNFDSGPSSVGLLSFCSFTIVGGLSGFMIAGNAAFKSNILGTLFMTGHFHPLLLGGITLSFLAHFLSLRIFLQPYSHKIFKFALISFLTGLMLMSGLMMRSGLWGSSRRFPIFSGPFPAIQAILLLIFGLSTLSSLFVILYSVLSSKEKEN